MATLPARKNDVEDHKQKGSHDGDLAEKLQKEGFYPDWVVTCSFYSALHFVDAYAHTLGVRTFEPAIDEKLSAHQKRLRFIDRCLKDYFGTYESLYNHCRLCRYDPEYYRLMLPIVPETMLKLARKFTTLMK